MLSPNLRHLQAKMLSPPQPSLVQIASSEPPPTQAVLARWRAVLAAVKVNEGLFKFALYCSALQ
jgi:hypothetical protein